MLGYTLPEVAIIAAIFALITLAPRVAEVGGRMGELLFSRGEGGDGGGSDVEPPDSSAP